MRSFAHLRTHQPIVLLLHLSIVPLSRTFIRPLVYMAYGFVIGEISKPIARFIDAFAE